MTMNIETAAKKMYHHHHNSYSRRKTPRGFVYIGSGSWRSAYGRGPYAYKIEHSPQSEFNRQELQTYLRVLEMDLPEWIKIPMVSSVPVTCDCGTCPEGGLVNVMDRLVGLKIPRNPAFSQRGDFTVSREEWERGCSIARLLNTHDMYPGGDNILFDPIDRTWWPVDMQFSNE